MGNQLIPESAVDFAQLPDRDLIEACRRKEAAAWEALILRYQRLIYSIPIRMGFSPVDAADVFQSVCVILLSKLDTLRKQERISSWLITVTNRECWRVAERWRRERPPDRRDEDDSDSPSLEAVSDLPPADAQREALEQQQILRQAVAALPDRCRALITLLFYEKEELSYSEIARRLGVPVSSIGPTRARCLERLRRDLDGKL